MRILEDDLTDYGVPAKKYCKMKQKTFQPTFQRNRLIVFIALLGSLQGSCYEDFDSDEEPQIELSIINSQDIRDVAPDDYYWEDRRPVNLRQPFWRVEKNVYELHYIPSVWTERFEQVPETSHRHPPRVPLRVSV